MKVFNSQTKLRSLNALLLVNMFRKKQENLIENGVAKIQLFRVSCQQLSQNTLEWKIVDVWPDLIIAEKIKQYESW